MSSEISLLVSTLQHEESLELSLHFTEEVAGIRRPVLAQQRSQPQATLPSYVCLKTTCVYVERG